MFRLQRLFLLFGLTLSLAACGGSGTTGGTADATAPASANGLTLPEGTNALLSVQITSSTTPAALSVETSDGTVEITTAFIGLKEIELKTAQDEEAEEAEFDLEGPFVVDLVNLSVTNLGTSHIDDDSDDDGEADYEDNDDDSDGIPDSGDSDDDNDGIDDSDDRVMNEIEIFDALELPQGTYTEIEAKLDRVEVEDGIDPAHPLAGKSLYVEGTLDGQEFRIEGDFDDELRIENENGITVNDASIASFILTFNLAGWFDGVDLSTAEIDEDGIVVLSDTSNTELFDIVKENIQSSSEIENDDGDDD